jgi:hypothetical protein
MTIEMKENKFGSGNVPRIALTKDFIKRNKLKFKPQNIIKDQFIEEFKNPCFFSADVLIDYLDYQNAKKFLTDEYIQGIESGDKTWVKIDTIEEAAQDFLDYMVFAWMKSEDERGISASRSIEKLGSWLFLMGRDDLSDLIHKKELYNPYGAPALIAVCDAMGIKVPDSLIEFSKNKC